MSGGARKVTLLICDDHKVLTDALAMVVGLDSDLKMVAAPVHTAEEAIQVAAEHLPDVVLMDIVFKGGMSGIEATRVIKTVSPSTRATSLRTRCPKPIFTRSAASCMTGARTKSARC